MKQRVLVLNQDYSPLTICSVERAFVLVFLDKAEMISSANGQQLRTVTLSYPLPAVIKINRFINLPYRQVVLTRQNVFKRDRFSCQYCGNSRDLTLDHVIPRSRNGKSTWGNLVTACKNCNSRKGDYLPEEVGFNLRTKPYKPSYILFLRNFSGFVVEEWEPYLNGYGTTRATG